MFRYCLFVFSLLIYSCNRISFSKKESVLLVDTIVDYTTVDASPSFPNCDAFIEDEKTACFRETMQQKLKNSLKYITITTQKDVDEVVQVVFLVSNTGDISINRVIATAKAQEVIPDLESYLQKSIDSLPKIAPAIKRGIPVTTQYTLPIQIQVR